MSRPIFSDHWYRVKTLKPKLRGHIRLLRQKYRGQNWYVLQDHANARYNRINAAAYQTVGLMDGSRTVHQIWEEVNTLLGDDAPLQDDIIQLMAKLHAADALVSDVPLNIEELFERGEKQEQRQRSSRYKNPLSVRIPLFDPDAFLTKTLPSIKWLFSTPMLIVWAVTVLVAVILASSHWGALVEAASLKALTPSNLILMVLVYPVIKLFHELGHAYAAKLEGGEVHEIGIMLLVMMPIPYVDASASIMFNSKYKRMLVSAMGIMVESFLAALALFLWLNVESGLVSDLALTVMLIGGISTVVFNGNPLLRYDGYYVLSDAIGIPNLAARANKYIGYLIMRYLFGVKDADTPVHGRGEGRWFFSYAITSFCYRMFLLVVISIYLAETLLELGIILVWWAITYQLLIPLVKHINFLLHDPVLRRKRQRAIAASSFIVILVVGFIFLVPISSVSQFEAVIWPPKESRLVANSEGFIGDIQANPGDEVKKGDLLITMRDELLASNVAVNEAHLQELNARYSAARQGDIVESIRIQDEIDSVESEYQHNREKIKSLNILSPVDGIFIIPDTHDLPGQFAHKGKLLGYVVDSSTATARLVVSQDDLEQINRPHFSVEVRLANDLGRVLPGEMRRQAPQAASRLPSKVLSTEGGGRYLLDPNSEAELATMERVYEYEIVLPISAKEVGIGTRVYVRFDHGAKPLAETWYRRIRQLFLRQFNV